MTTLPPVTVSPEEKRQLLDRVLKSQTFSRSDQLKRFLQYICEKDIAGDAHHLNEYSIAVEALGRPANYSPSEDSSVRTRAHALRQKLQEYYELEAGEAELRIQVPKGSYHPQFVREPAVEAPFVTELPIAVPPPLNVPARYKGRFWRPFLAGVIATLTILAVGLAIYLAVRPPRVKEASQLDEIVRQTWGQMLQVGEEVEICIATPPAMLLHSYKEGQLPPIGPHLLATPKEIAEWYDGLQMVDGGGQLFMHRTQDVFLFGDSLAASSAVQLIARAGAIPLVMPESNLRAFVLRGHNVLLIGSPNYSPLAARFLMNTPLSVHYDPVKGDEVVSDGITDGSGKLMFRPRHNEHGMLTEAYGLITIFPSQPEGMGKAKTIILSGITSAGPQAALEFLRSGDSLRLLMRKLRVEGYKQMPPAIQIVVRCGLDHNLALNWEYAAHVVVNNSLFSN